MKNRFALFLLLFSFTGAHAQTASTVTPKWSERIPFLDGVFYVNPKLVKDGSEYYMPLRVSVWTGEVDNHYSADGFCTLAQGFPSKAPWNNAVVQDLGEVPLMAIDTSGNFLKLDPHRDDGPVPMVLFCLNRKSDPINLDRVKVKTEPSDGQINGQEIIITSVSVDLPFTISHRDYFGAIYLESFQPSTVYRPFYSDESLLITRTLCEHVGYPYPTQLPMTMDDYPANTPFFDTTARFMLDGFRRPASPFPLIVLFCQK